MRNPVNAMILGSFAVFTVASTGCTVREVVVRPRREVVVEAAPQPVVVQATVPVAPVVVQTPVVASHPAYLHALSDLRNARANLVRRGGDLAMVWSEADAIAEVDRAIHEIKEASVEDGKNLDDHPPVDAGPRGGRLHQALSDLRAARADISKEEDNAWAQGLQARAYHHIDEAIRFTEGGIAAAH